MVGESTRFKHMAVQAKSGGARSTTLSVAKAGPSLKTASNSPHSMYVARQSKSEQSDQSSSNPGQDREGLRERRQLSQSDSKDEGPSKRARWLDETGGEMGGVAGSRIEDAVAVEGMDLQRMSLDEQPVEGTSHLATQEFISGQSEGMF